MLDETVRREQEALACRCDSYFGVPQVCSALTIPANPCHPPARPVCCQSSQSANSFSAQSSSVFPCNHKRLRSAGRRIYCTYVRRNSILYYLLVTFSLRTCIVVTDESVLFSKHAASANCNDDFRGEPVMQYFANTSVAFSAIANLEAIVTKPEPYAV